LNTEQSGAAKIQDDTENLKTEFEKLMATVQDLRTKLTAKISQLEDSNKVKLTHYKLFWNNLYIK
jgi:nesprin-1